MPVNMENNAFAKIKAECLAAATEMLVYDKGLLPTAFPFKIRAKRVDGSGNVTQQEVMNVTNVTGTTLTIVRAVEKCPINETSTSHVQTAFNFDDGDIIEVVYTAQMIKDMQNLIETKANDSEVVKKTGNHTMAGDLTANQFIGDGSLITGIQAEVESTSLNYMLGGTGTVGKGYSLNPYEQLSVGTSNDFGSVAQPEVAQSFYAQNVDIATLKLMIRKFSSPSDNILLEIQTDNAGVPSGTVVTNGTSDNIAGTGLTTSFVETSFTFASVPVLTEATLYHIVVKRSGADDTVNYYGVESAGSDVQIGTASLNTGTWANTTDDLYFKMQTGYQLITLSDKDTNNNYVGHLQLAGIEGQIRKVNGGYDKNQIGLIIGNSYGLGASGNLITGLGFKAISTTEIVFDLEGLKKGVTGTIQGFAGTTAPYSYQLCDATAISRTIYAELFALIGTAYGIGDGSTTFNVPDLRGRIPVGKDTGTFATLGGTGGTETHTLTVTEMPAHIHKGTLSYDGTVLSQISAGEGTVLGSNQDIGGSQGGGAAHNILQPYGVINYIIKL